MVPVKGGFKQIPYVAFVERYRVGWYRCPKLLFRVIQLFISLSVEIRHPLTGVSIDVLAQDYISKHPRSI